MPAVINPNYNLFSNSQSDAGRELVVKITRGNGSVAIRHEDLLAAYRQLTSVSPVTAVTRDPVAGNVRTGPDTATVAAVGTAAGTAFVSGTSTAVFMRVQTTGTPKVTDITTDGGDIKFEVVAYFAPLF